MNIARVVEGFDNVVSLSGATYPMVVVELDNGHFVCTTGAEFLDDPDTQMAKDFGLWDAFWEDNCPPLPEFTSAAAARRHEELSAQQSIIGEDLAAFGAPEECAPIAYRGFENKHADELAWLEQSCVNAHIAGSPII